MRTLLLSLVVLLLPSFVLAAEDVKLAEFKTKLEAAIGTKDLKALNELFHAKGASQYQVDVMASPFEEYWTNYDFKSVEFTKLDSSALQNLAGQSTMNGHVYVPNLTPVAFCSVRFMDKNGSSSVSTMSPVGVAPDGSVRFVLKVPKE